MSWNDVLQNENFRKLGPEGKREKADLYFKERIEKLPEYQAAGKVKKQQARVKFLSTIGQQPDEIGGFFTPLKRGLATSQITSGMLELMANWAPEGMPMFGREDLQEAADFWRKRAEAAQPEMQKTGAYTQPSRMFDLDPTSPYSPLNPKRAFNVIGEGLPMLGLFIGAHIVNPWFGRAVMAVAEGGDAAKSLRDYEEETGTKVPGWQKKLIPMTVGLVNAKLEEMGIETLLGKRFGGLVKGKLAKLLLRSGVEGSEEFLQEGVQILGEAAYGKEHQVKQVLSDLWNSFYGGALLGGVIGGAVIPFEGVKAPVEDTVGAEDLPAGLRGGPMAARLRDLQVLHEEIAKDPSNEKLRTALAAAEADFVSKWKDINPSDVTGEVMDRALENIGIMRTGAVKRVLLTEELADQTKFNVELPDGKILPVDREQRVSKTDVERTLTAIDWLATKTPKLMGLANRVHIIAGAEGSWLNGLSKAVTGLTRNRLTKDFPDRAAKLKEDFTDAGSAIWTDADGKTQIALRAKYKDAKQFKTSRYVNLIAHELQHAAEDAGMVEVAEELKTAIAGEERAVTAGKEAAETFMAEAPELEFQEKETYRSEIEREVKAPTMKERLRLEHGLGQLFTAIKRYEGQLYNEQGFPVNAAVNKDTGELYLSGTIDYNTIGHEGFELAIEKLGWDNEIVKKGLEFTGGNKEFLSDFVGKYYSDYIMEPSIAERLGLWLKELWAEFQNVVEADLSQEQIVALLNRRMRKISFGPVQNKLRVFDTLDAYKGNINLEQLPLKGISGEESAFVTAIANRLKRQGKRVISPNDLKAALTNELVEVRIAPEGERELGPGYTAGEFEPRTHIRLMFETPVNFEQEAHIPSGIMSTTAIGWAEVAEPPGDPDTMIVFEVQPSDAFEKTVPQVTGIPSEPSGRLNQFLYRALIQDAARKGYKKIRFPVGETVAKIEGNTDTVELYNKMAARIEKEWKGRTERVTTGATGEDVSRYTGAADDLVTIARGLEPGQHRLIDYKDLLGGIIDVLHTEGKWYADRVVQTLDGKIHRYGFTPWMTSLSSFEEMLRKAVAKQTPAQFPWLEVSLLPEDGTNGALRFQRVSRKFWDPQFTQRTETPKQRKSRLLREDYRAYISLRNRDMKELLAKYRRDINVRLPEPGPSLEEVQRKADIFLADPRVNEQALKLLRRLDAREGLNPQEYFNLSVYSVHIMDATAQELFNKDDNSDIINIINNDVMNNWHKVYREAGAEPARALRYRRMLSSYSMLAEAVAGIKVDKNLTEDDIAKITELAKNGKVWTDPRAAKELAEQIRETQEKRKPSTVLDHVWSIFYNGILFGAIPVNLFSNAAWLGWLMTGEHTTMAAIETGRTSALTKALFPKLSAPAQKAFFSDIVAMWSGAVRGPLGAGGVTSALRVGWRVFRGKQDIPTALKVKWKHELGPAWGAFHRSPVAALRKAAPAMEFTTNVLMSTDIVFRSIAADVHLNMELQRMARASGLTAAQVAESLSKESMEQLIDNAGRFGQMATFFDKPGRLATVINSLRKLPPLQAGRAILPFVNTLVNILKRGAEYTPGVGLLALASDTEGSRLAARQLQGAIVTFALLGLFWDDDRMTGAPPANQAERLLWAAAKKQPWSFKVGDKWVPYHRVEPFNVMISNIIAFRDAVKETMEMKEERGEVDWTEWFGNLSQAVSDNLMRSYPAENMIRIIGEKGARTRWVTRLPSSFVPFSSFFRSLSRTIEYVQDGTVKSRESLGVIANLAQLIPWGPVEEAMPARITALGTEIELPAGGLQQFLPFAWAEQAPEDSVESELIRLEHYPGLPSQRLTVGRREVWLPDDFFREYALLYGKYTKEALVKAMDTAMYKRLPTNEAKIKFLDRRTDAARDRARSLATRRARELGLDRR